MRAPFKSRPGADKVIVLGWPTGAVINGTTICAVAEVHGCDFYTFRDGKVTAKDSYWKIVE